MLGIKPNEPVIEGPSREVAWSVRGGKGISMAAAKVLLASWDSLGDGDDISLTVQNINGDELGQLHSFRSATVGDLEAQLLDPQGPLFEHISSPILNFYTTADPEKELELQQQLRELGPTLIIKQPHVGICLEMWPDTGKFLEAMYHSKFNPQSQTFEVTWTARKAEKVPVREALRLVRDVLSGTASHAESESQFVQVFGRLTSLIEQWNMFNLALLQQFDPGQKTFKHAVCRSLLELARAVAASMVSDLPNLDPVILYNGRAGCYVVGHEFPSQFGRILINSLRLNDFQTGFQWEPIASGLLCLDWNFPEESRESLKDRTHKLYHQEPPEKFGTLRPDEILQMVHVQLRLSCCKVAKVQGSLNEALGTGKPGNVLNWLVGGPLEVCVEILAELLGYKLKVVKFKDFEGLEQEIQIFDRETEHMEPDRSRGSLVLVSDLPLKEEILTSTFGNRHRMILCYNADA
eukprot:Skav204097  [mRNA]  locus=scaffold3129:496457:498954:+ [translate_table: standard]